MEYRVIRTGQSDDHFEHALFGGGRQKGAQNKNHKYLARAWWQNKWRYAYTQAEVIALQNLGKARQAAKDVGDKAKAAASTVKSVATGNYAKSIDSGKAQSQAAANRAENRMVSQANKKNYDAAQRAQNAANKHSNDVANYEKRQQSAVYKVSKAAGNAGATIKNATSKGKSKANEIAAKVTSTVNNIANTPNRNTATTSTNGRKYAGTGKKAEARKDEGGVSGGPVNNSDMSNRPQTKDKKQSLGEKASAIAGAVKTGAYITKKNVENYFDNNNNKTITDTAGKSTLHGRKVTTSYSEGDSLLSKSELKKKTNADGSVEYEHHTEYGKIAQAAKKGKEAVENLFGEKKTPKYSISTNKLEEYTPPWLEGYHFKNGKMTADKSVAETFEKGKAKAKEVLNKVKDTASKVSEDARNSAAGRYVTNAVEARKAEKERDAATAAGDRKAAIDAENRRENARVQQNKAVNDIKEDFRDAANSVKEGARDAAKNARNAVKETGANISNAAKKAADVATGNYSKNVESQLVKERETAKRAQEDINKQYRMETNALKRKLNNEQFSSISNKAKERANNAAAAEERARANAKAGWDTKLKAEQRARELENERDSAAYKVSETINNAKDTVKETGAKVSDKAKETADNVKDKASQIGENIASAAKDAGKSAANKGKAAAEKILNKVSSTAKSAAEKVANSEVGQKVSDTAEKVSDKIDDVKTSVQHKSYANEMKRKYGADSLHYKDAQALVEHDKAANELEKARDKYGVNSSEYKAAMAKEQRAQDAMDEAHEQNLYENHPRYKQVVDRASEIGAYLDNMDARGGPQTAEGKANYRKMQQELSRLEDELERMWNEDWE